jgi:hypothetical protein
MSAEHPLSIGFARQLQKRIGITTGPVEATFQAASAAASLPLGLKRHFTNADFSLNLPLT